MVGNDSAYGCTNCTCLEIQEAWEEYHVWYQTATSSLGVLANVLILATILFAGISHSCHVYVLALTLGDLGYSICRLFSFHYLHLPKGAMGLWQCRLLYSAENLCRGLSNWVMVLLASDRLRVVVAPLRTHAKGGRLTCAAALTWTACLIMLVVNVPRLAYTIGNYNFIVDSRWYSVCYFLKSTLAQALRATDLAFTFHIPVIANAVINIALVFCLLRMLRRRKRLSQQPIAKHPANTERQLTRMLVATSLMHSFFSLPMAWLEVVNLREAFVQTTNYFMYLCINYAFGIFYSWQAFVNLPIYVVYNTSFREHFFRILLPCWNRRETKERPSRSRVSTAIDRLSETNM